MVQMTRSEWQNVVTRLFVINTSGDIEADEVRVLLNDLGDSVDFLAPAQAPSIRSFIIADQPTNVDPDTALTGEKSFIYTVANSDAVVGDLTLQQEGVNLSTTIDPKGNAEDVTINDITLAAGESVTFTLSGTDGTTPFSDTFTITARTIDEYIYFGTQVSSDPSTFDFANESRSPFQSGNQNIAIPTFTGNEHLVIAQKNADPDFTGIFIDGINQIGAFTKTLNAFTVNAAGYDAWVSNNPLVGSVVSGDLITLER